MQKDDIKRTSNDLQDRAMGYTRRPVAAIQSRYKTAPSLASHIKHTTTIEQVVAQPKAAPIKKIETASVPPVLLHPKHHQPSVHNKLISDTQIAVQKRYPSTVKTQRQTNVLSSYLVSNRTYGNPIAKIPTLPTPTRNPIKRSYNKIKFVSRQKKSGMALSALAVLLLIGGIVVNVHSFSVTNKIEAQSGQAINAGENGRPDGNSGLSEEQPNGKSINEYKVAPDLPKLLQIPSLGTLARIVRVGVESNNQVGTPKNVFDAAWYEGSAKPGQPGAVFIDGHVLGPTKGGVFANLKNIKVGASITIVMGNDTNYTYKVVATEKVDADKVDMNKVLRSADASKQGLNLMTCNGTYLKDTKTFDKRLIVYAVRES